jgi:Hexokinase
MLVSRVITKMVGHSQHMSFRVNRQERIDHGELIRWTKGFGAPNTEGRDVADMFRKSLEKHVRIAFSLRPDTAIVIFTRDLPLLRTYRRN